MARRDSRGADARGHPRSSRPDHGRLAFLQPAHQRRGRRAVPGSRDRGPAPLRALDSGNRGAQHRASNRNRSKNWSFRISLVWIDNVAFPFQEKKLSFSRWVVFGTVLFILALLVARSGSGSSGAVETPESQVLTPLIMS